MLSEEENQAIEYLKSRLYGNEGCKFIDVAQSDLRIFLKLVENLQKDIESWKKYCDEQENDITLKNNKVCDLEFKIEKQSKEIEELKEKNENLLDALNNSIDIRKYWVSKDKIKAKIEEIDLAVFKNQTIYTVNKMQEIKFARLCLAELLEKE